MPKPARRIRASEVRLANANQVLGKEGERVAERYLKNKGYKVVERNYRCAAGEVDLIVVDRRVIVFVEVKTRSDDRFGTPVEAVHPAKQRKMAKTAQFFLNQNGLEEREARFDVVGISWPGRTPIVEHIENAFELA